MLVAAAVVAHLWVGANALLTFFNICSFSSYKETSLSRMTIDGHPDKKRSSIRMNENKKIETEDSNRVNWEIENTRLHRVSNQITNTIRRDLLML
jgi:hypothetical protein